MKKLLTTFAMLALISACGGADEAPEVSVQSEAAGDQCPDGGVHVAIDDEDHYVCHGEDGDDGEPGTHGEDGESPTITTAEVAADDADNPCDTDAIEITVEHIDGTTSVEYLCQPPEDAEFLVGYFESMAEVTNDQAMYGCECEFDNWGYTDVEECIAGEQAPYSAVQYSKTCIGSAYSDYDRPAPQGFVDYLECQTDMRADIVACWDLADDEDICSQTSTDAVQDCQSDIYNNQFDACDEIMGEDEEAQDWADEFDDFLDLSCPDVF